MNPTGNRKQGVHGVASPWSLRISQLHIFTQDFLKQECAVLKDFEKCKEEWASSRNFETLERSFIAVASNHL